MEINVKKLIKDLSEGGTENYTVSMNNKVVSDFRENLKHFPELYKKYFPELYELYFGSKKKIKPPKFSNALEGLMAQVNAFIDSVRKQK